MPDIDLVPGLVRLQAADQHRVRPRRLAVRARLRHRATSPATRTPPSTASTTSRARARRSSSRAPTRPPGPAPLTVEFSADRLARPGRRPRSPTRGTSTATASTDSTAIKPDPHLHAAGRHTATLTVTDAAGQVGRASVNITAGNTAPTVKITFPAAGRDLRLRRPDPVPDHGHRPRGRHDRLQQGPLRHRARPQRAHARRPELDRLLRRRSRSRPPWEDKTQHTFYVLDATYTDATHRPGADRLRPGRARAPHAAGRVPRRAARHPAGQPSAAPPAARASATSTPATGCASTTST